jgi:hypothetical protein
MPRFSRQSYLGNNRRRLIAKCRGSKLFIVCFVLAFASFLLSVSTGSQRLNVSTGSQEFRATKTVFTKGPGNLRFRTQTAAPTKVEYQGGAAEAMRSGSIRPLSLGAGDFNLDGAPDLVTGYAGPTGILTLQLGNKDAFAPKNPAVYKAIHEGRMPPTFVEGATTYQLPFEPDFLLVEDFDNDGIKDVLAAARSGEFDLLTGDGRGGLASPQSFDWLGRISAVAAGQFNRRDGLVDLAVALVGSQGPVVLVYHGVEGGLSNTPFTYSLPAEASFVGLENLDGDDFSDLAVASGNELVIIHGRKTIDVNAQETAGQRETINVPFRLRSATFGEFTWDRDSRPEIALLAEDGTTHLLQRSDLDTRAFTELEVADLAKQQEVGKPADPAKLRKAEAAWQSRGAPEWVIAGRLDVNVSGTDQLPHSPLMRMRLPGPTDGLIAVDSVQQKIRISSAKHYQTKPENEVHSKAIDSESSLGGQPVTVLELPKKVNGERELLVLNSDSIVPNAVIIAAATTPEVDRFDDPTLLPVASPQSAPEAQCNDAVANDCSLRGSIVYSNQAANIPATITVPAGTYTLDEITAGENNSRLGDLDVNGAGTVIVGAGSATTTVRWDPAIPNASRDRLLQFNSSQAIVDFDFQVSGITFTGGFIPTSGSGGAINGGAGSGSVYTFSDCIFSGNTANNNGGGMSISFDVQDQDVNLTDCEFTNNTASTGAGGGFNYLGAGTVTVSAGTIVSGNAANQGGGMTLGGSTGAQSFTLPKLSIINNSATADGGGIMLNSGTLNLSFSRFFGNTAVSCADGLCRAGGAVGTATATNNWWGCNTDPTSGGAAADGCDTVGFGSGGSNPTVNPRLQLTHTANPTTLCRTATSNLTASFLVDSSGGAVAVANLDRLIGLPITFNNAVNGAISSPQATIQANGTATATFTAGANHGAASADATVDNGTATAAMTVPNVFNSATTGNFDVATTWTPQCVPQSDDSVIINNTHTVSLPGGSNIADVTINAGGTLNTSTFNLNVNSSNSLKNYNAVNSWSNSGSLSGLGTVTFNGNNVLQKLAGTSVFNNLTINHTGSSNVTATGSTLTVNALMRVQSGLFISSSTFNNVQIDGGATLQSDGGTINVQGNWTNDGTFTPNGGTVIFNGSGAQTIAGAATTGFNVLTISNTAQPVVVSPTTNLMNAAGNLSISASAILSPAAAAVIGGAGTLTGSGTAQVTRTAATADFLSQYTITNKTLTNLTVEYIGAAAQVLSPTTFGPLKINNGSGVNLNTGNAVVNGLLTLTSGALDVGAARTLNINNGSSIGAGTLTSNTTGTVVFGQLSNGQNIITANYGNLTFSNFNKILPATTVGVAGAFTAPTATGHTITGNTINFNGTGGQTIPAFNYNDLTSSSTGARTLANAGTIGIAGTFTPGTNAYTITGSTIDFNGSGAQTISAFNYNNLTISGARTVNNVTLASTGTIGIAATFAVTASFAGGGFVVTGSTVDYNGTAAQAMPAALTTYNNLTISNSSVAGVTGISGLVVQGLLTVSPGSKFTSASDFVNVLINGTLAGTNLTTMNVSGNWTNNGTFQPNGNTVNFNGNGTAQTISGATTFDNFQLSHTGANGVTLSSDILVNGLATFTSGTLTTGINTFSMGAAATRNHPLNGGYIIGNEKKTYGAAGAFTFDVGTANGYSPVDVNVTAGTGDFTIKATQAPQPNVTAGASLQRYWTLTATGMTADLVFHYLQGDVMGNEPTYRIIRVSGGVPVSFPNSCPSPCVDDVNNTGTINGVSNFSDWTLGEPVAPTAANGTVGGQILDDQGNPVEGAAVRMSGSQTRLTVTDAAGKYRFDNVETNGLYVVMPSRANFTFSPSQRSFSQLGQHTEATFTAAANGGTLNPLDASEYFVRQQYVDFLGREPDEPGFNFWVNNIQSCGADVGCREVKRIDTSAAFFLSIEFQQTGYVVYRAYQAAFGDITNAPVPLKLNEFKPDTQQISNGVVVLQDGWQQKLESNKQAFMNEFVQRARFTAAYPAAMTPAVFVDKLFANTGTPVIDPDRAAAIAEFGTATDTSDAAARARALRRVAENATVARLHFNEAFVLMEYFGYLRRNPVDAPEQTLDYTGYNFWLTKLNGFNGNFRDAEMVKAFLASDEYRDRFAP